MIIYQNLDLLIESRFKSDLLFLARLYLNLRVKNGHLLTLQSMTMMKVIQSVRYRTRGLGRRAKLVGFVRTSNWSQWIGSVRQIVLYKVRSRYPISFIYKTQDHVYKFPLKSLESANHILILICLIFLHFYMMF